MATINNESAYILPVSSQEAIRNALAAIGISEVSAKFAYANGDVPIFDIEDMEKNYLFSLDASDDSIFDK